MVERLSYFIMALSINFIMKHINFKQNNFPFKNSEKIYNKNQILTTYHSTQFLLQNRFTEKMLLTKK